MLIPFEMVGWGKGILVYIGDAFVRLFYLIQARPQNPLKRSGNGPSRNIFYSGESALHRPPVLVCSSAAPSCALSAVGVFVVVQRAYLLSPEVPQLGQWQLVNCKTTTVVVKS